MLTIISWTVTPIHGIFIKPTFTVINEVLITFYHSIDKTLVNVAIQKRIEHEFFFRKTATR